MVGPRVATAEALEPIKNKSMQPKNGTILVPLSRAKPSGRWQAYVAKSTDLSKNWYIIPIDPGSAFDVIQPSILVHSSNRLHLLGRSKQGAGVQVWSADSGNT